MSPLERQARELIYSMVRPSDMPLRPIPPKETLADYVWRREHVKLDNPDNEEVQVAR